MIRQSRHALHGSITSQTSANLDGMCPYGETWLKLHLAQAALIQLHCHFLTELDFFDFVLETLPVAILRGGVLVSLVPFCCAAWAFGSAGNDCWICSPASSTA